MSSFKVTAKNTRPYFFPDTVPVTKAATGTLFCHNSGVVFFSIFSLFKQFYVFYILTMEIRITHVTLSG